MTQRPLHSLAMLTLIVTVAATAACSRRPSMVLSHNDMVELLADVHEAEGVVSQNMAQYKTDSSRMQLRMAVYARHGVTAEIVDSSLAWYGYNLDKYVEVYDDVIKLLDKRMASVKADRVKKSSDDEQMAMDGDSVVVWQTYTPALFSPRLAREYVSNTLNRDPFWQPDDRYELKFKGVNVQRCLDASLIAVYEDNTTQTVHRSYNAHDGWNSIYLDLDTAHRVRSLTVNLRYKPGRDDIDFTAIDSITLMRTRAK